MVLSKGQLCVEKKFKLGTRRYEEYKGVCFGNGDCALVVDVCPHRVDEDVSGLTFEEWDPSVDTDASEAPVAMIVNSSELRTTGFDLRESDTAATRDGGAWRPAYTRRDPQEDSRHGHQEVCTLRG
jgi:hypothetical protein